MSCPSLETLARWQHELLPAGEAAEVEAHVVQCNLCSQRLPAVLFADAGRGSDASLPASPRAEVSKYFVVVPSQAEPGKDVPCIRSETGEIRYEILGEPVGEGGMSLVYRVHDRKLPEALTAIKVLAPRGVLEGSRKLPDDHLKRFRQEIDAISQLPKSHFLGIHDCGVLTGEGRPSLPYFVMEYVAGGSLAMSLKDRCPKTPQQVLEYVVEPGLHLANGLVALHGRGFVHRDIKPSNILLRDARTPVIADLGIAKNLSETARFTGTGVWIGTPGYMSPEQERGEPVDYHSDLYSFGLVLQAMCLGRDPRREDPPARIRNEDREGSPIVVPQSLVDLIVQLRDPNPDRRPQTALEVVQRLEEIREEIHARKPPASPAIWDPSIPAPTRFFYGRKAERAILHNAFRDPKRRRAIQAITGLGGMGKTQTAIAYATEYRSEYRAVLWVCAEDERTLRAGYVRLASLLRLEERNWPEQDSGGRSRPSLARSQFPVAPPRR